MLIALSAALLSCQEGVGDLEERVAAETGGLLEVDLYMGEGLRPDQGSLEVRSHDALTVRVVAEASGWGASGVSYRLEQEGNTVRLYGRVTGALSWLFGGPRMNVRIWVPREFSLDLRTSAGPIHIDDVSGRVQARAADDAIEVSAISGRLKLRTKHGNVRLSEVQGEVDLRVSEGTISLSWVSGDVEARTGRGAIEADHVTGSLTLTSGRGEIEIRELDGTTSARTERGSVFASFVGDPGGTLETSRGNVHVTVADGAGAALAAVSRSGSVELTGLEVDGVNEASRVDGRLGSGGAPLRLYTARGSIKVSRR
jgi:DUF4097 and DUF4098 domain-containing protein YvlB